MPAISVKPYFFIFLLLQLCIQLPAQTYPNRNEKELEVQVMLFDNVKDIQLPPYCGIRQTDVVVKYKVMNVIHGFYLNKTILIHSTCLREAIENHTIDNHVTYVYKVKPVLPLQDDPKKQTYEIVL